VPTVRFGDFEWDAAKAAANLRRHGVSFVEATEVFDDPHALECLRNGSVRHHRALFT
jgi:uncharacterized DUF497 family protein